MLAEQESLIPRDAGVMHEGINIPLLIPPFDKYSNIKNLGGIMLRVKHPDTAKWKVFQAQMQVGGLTVPLVALKAEAVPEEVFNKLTGEVGAAIAGCKVFQRLPKNPILALRNLAGLEQDPTGHILVGAGDVVVGYQRQNGGWADVNKPDAGSTHQSIMENISQLVGTGSGYLFENTQQARVTNGELWVAPIARRVLTGTMETFFMFEPLPPAAVALYVFGKDRASKHTKIDQALIDFEYELAINHQPLDQVQMAEFGPLLDGPSLESLMQVNAGIRLESPIFRRRIRMINGRVLGEPQFQVEFRKLMMSIRGVPWGRFDLIDQLADLARTSNKRTHGNQYAAVSSTVKEYLNMDIQGYSVFGFHPRNGLEL